MAIEIPAKVKQAIDIDDEPSWIIVSEHNVDEWPNAGLSPVPGKRGEFAYGFIPPGLFAKIKAGLTVDETKLRSGLSRFRRMPYSSHGSRLIAGTVDHDTV